MLKGHLEDEKTSWLAFWTCFIAYTSICMSNNTYSAAIAAIVQEGIFSKTNAGVINSCFFLFYGSTQFLGGYLADRVSPFKIIMIGLTGAALANAGMAASGSFAGMLIAWSVNGATQFGVWPAVVKIISSVLIKEHRPKAMIFISFCYSIGMMISYLSAMAILRSGRWPGMFRAAVLVLIVTIGCFLLSVWRIRRKMVPDKPEAEALANPPGPKAEPAGAAPLVRMLARSGLLFLLAPALIRCMLDLGLKSWTPTMIMESYGVSPGFASMLATVLLTVNLSGVFLVVELYPKRCKSITTAINVFFLASVPLLALLFFIGRLPVGLVVVFLALVTTFMTAAGQMFNVILPTAYARYQKTGIVAGILNAFACFGSVIANVIYGFLAERFGWNVTILSWVVLAAVAVVFCQLATPAWKRFTGPQ